MTADYITAVMVYCALVYNQNKRKCTVLLRATELVINTIVDPVGCLPDDEYAEREKDGEMAKPLENGVMMERHFSVVCIYKKSEVLFSFTWLLVKKKRKLFVFYLLGKKKRPGLFVCSGRSHCCFVFLLSLWENNNNNNNNIGVGFSSIVFLFF